MTVALRQVGDGVQFAVKVVPGASRDRVVGAYGEALQVAVTAPPEGGKANAAVCALLAELFGVPARAVTVVSGHGNPRKVVAVGGVALARASDILATLR
ncbi:MAG: DUF167 domain-containing protein [Planctomycetes bacterium]|nr:DUF167 domain-containing protein [Planctomycetota bacterium]